MSATQCVVCDHGDCGVIERLLAGGVQIRELSASYGFTERELKRHDALHSTQAPQIDPAQLLRFGRWLLEKSEEVTEQVLAKKGKKPRGDAFNRKLAALRTGLTALDTMVRLTDASKMLSPAVTLPRWRQVQAKIIDALKDHPQALRSVLGALDASSQREEKETNTPELAPLLIDKKEKKE